jgi:hypothetical protein
MENTVSQVQYIDIDKLTVIDNNPRTIINDNFLWLCDSLKEDKQFFENRPCLVNELEGKLIVYAGSQRLKVATHLKWKQVPCIVNKISDELMQERALKDNDHVGEWDNEKLLQFDEKLLQKVNLKKLAKPKKQDLKMPVIPEMFLPKEETINTNIEDEDEDYESPMFVQKVESKEDERKSSKGKEQITTLEIYMKAENRSRVLQVLNEIKEKYGYDKLEDALMRLCEGYKG